MVSCKGSIKILMGASRIGNFRCRYTTWECRGSTPIQPRVSVNPIYLNSFTFRRYSSETSSEQIDLIKQLRERTSAPIKDVKSSLVDCKWDIDAAQKELRKRGVVIASKKSSRVAAEGLLAVVQSDNRAIAIELNCETDFVARNDVFQHLALTLARTALSTDSPVQMVQGTFNLDSECLQNMKIDLNHPKLSGDTTVQSAITEVSAMVGENIKLRRGFAVSTMSHGVICSYLHSCPQPDLGRIAGLLTIEAEDTSVSLEVLKKVGSSLAMHVVAAKPLFLSREHVSSEAIENERDIFKSQSTANLMGCSFLVDVREIFRDEVLHLPAHGRRLGPLMAPRMSKGLNSGKSPSVMEKMMEGRLRKYFEEVVLLEQKFVMNDTINIKSVLDDLSKEVGSSVKICDFLRIEVGEGIQRI